MANTWDYIKDAAQVVTGGPGSAVTMAYKYSPQALVSTAQYLDPETGREVPTSGNSSPTSTYFNTPNKTGALVQPTIPYKSDYPKAADNTNTTSDPATPFQVVSSNPNQPTEGVSAANINTGNAALSQQQTNTTGVVVDPSIERVKGQVANRSAGVGDGFGNLEVPKQPDIKTSYADQMKTIGDRVSLSQNNIPTWHDSDSFNYGLLNFGLNLLSGNDLATSFSTASKTFADMYGQEKRQIWGEDLRKQGYDDTEIQRYIETGDNKVLTDPFEKQSRLMDYNTKAAQLDQARYETSPEMRQYQLDKDKFSTNLELKKMQADEDYRRQQLGMEAERLNLQRQQNKQELELKKLTLEAKNNPNGLSSRDISQLQTASRDSIRNLQQKYTNSQLADKALKDLEEAAKRGDNDTVQGQYNAFREYQARAMLGGGATLTPKQLQETTGLPATFDQARNVGLMGLTGTPTEKWVNIQKAVTQRAIENERQIVYDKAESLYQALLPQYGHVAATNATNRVMSGSGMGSFKFDPDSQVAIRPSAVANKKTVTITRE